MKNLYLVVFHMCFILYFIFANICWGENYNRDKHFGSWIDSDYDGQDTRQEVLIRDSIIPVGYDSNGKVYYGIWLCPYTGAISTNPLDFDVDHFVPLKEAYDSGANDWNKEKRNRYANYLIDENHLLAVAASSNRQKGAKDINLWLPLLEEAHYIINWMSIKKKWNLCFDNDEITVIEEKLGKNMVPDNVCK